MRDTLEIGYTFTINYVGYTIIDYIVDDIYHVERQDGKIEQMKYGDIVLKTD